MKLGSIKLVKNAANSSGPIGQEASEYFDVWVESYGATVPIRLTRREFERAASRGRKQLQEIKPLRKPLFARLFGGG